MGEVALLAAMVAVSMVAVGMAIIIGLLMIEANVEVEGATVILAITTINLQILDS